MKGEKIFETGEVLFLARSRPISPTVQKEIPFFFFLFCFWFILFIFVSGTLKWQFLVVLGSEASAQIPFIAAV